MKKLLFLILFIPSNLFAWSQTNQTYRDEKTIRREFNNIYLNAQSKQFEIFKTTPNLNQLQDGQIVLVSSTNRGLAWRDGQTVYFMTSSGSLYSTTFVTYTSNTYISNGVSRIVAGTDISITPSGGTGEVTVNYNGTDTSAMSINWEELLILNNPTQINFKGSGVAVAQSGSTATVTITGGGGGGVADGSDSGDLWELDSGGDIQPSLVVFANDVNSDLDSSNQIMFKPYTSNIGNHIILCGVWAIESARGDYEPAD